MNRTVHTKTLWLVAVSLLLTACSKDAGMDQERYIRLRPVTAAMVAASTRGTQVTTAPASYGASCAVYAGAGGYTSAQQGSRFFNQHITSSGETGYYWPAPSKLIAVYAYYPYGDASLMLTSTTASTGYPTYSYTVPDSPAQQKDVMTANMTDIRCDGSQEVDIVFSHRLSDFCMRIENYTGYDLRVNSITVKNLKYTGTLTGSQWTLGNARKDFTLTLNQTVTPTNSLDATGSTDHFLMLPQTITAGSQLIDVSLTISGNTHHFYYQPATDFTPQQGAVYTFVLCIKHGISTDVTVGEWENVNLGFNM